MSKISSVEEQLDSLLNAADSFISESDKVNFEMTGKPDKKFGTKSDFKDALDKDKVEHTSKAKAHVLVVGDWNPKVIKQHREGGKFSGKKSNKAAYAENKGLKKMSYSSFHKKYGKKTVQESIERLGAEGIMQFNVGGAEDFNSYGKWSADDWTGYHYEAVVKEIGGHYAQDDSLAQSEWWVNGQFVPGVKYGDQIEWMEDEVTDDKEEAIQIANIRAKEAAQRAFEEQQNNVEPENDMMHETNKPKMKQLTESQVNALVQDRIKTLLLEFTEEGYFDGHNSFPFHKSPEERAAMSGSEKEYATYSTSIRLASGVIKAAGEFGVESDELIEQVITLLQQHIQS